MLPGLHRHHSCIRRATRVAKRAAAGRNSCVCMQRLQHPGPPFSTYWLRFLLACLMHRFSLLEDVMARTNEDFRIEINKTVERIVALRDEARLKLHLAGMDARDRWNQLEPKIADAERAASQATRTTLLSVQATAKKLEDLLASM